MTTEQEIKHAQQMEKNRLQRKAIYEWFCKLNGLEKIIVIVSTSSLLLLSSYTLNKASEASDNAAAQHRSQETIQAIHNLQQIIEDCDVRRVCP